MTNQGKPENGKIGIPSWVSGSLQKEQRSSVGLSVKHRCCWNFTSEVALEIPNAPFKYVFSGLVSYFTFSVILFFQNVFVDES